MQDSLRQKGYEDIYGIGLSLGPVFDPIFMVEDFFGCFRVNLLTDEGELRADDPQVKEGIVNMLNFIKSLYEDGYIPPGATAWKDPDNNLAFHSKKIVLVLNPTLSIPGYWYLENKEVYRTQTATILKPVCPDGGPWPTIVRPGFFNVFKMSENKELAKEFIKFFLRDENLLPFIKGHAGRFLPVFKDHTQDPFFTNPEDPHIPVAAKYLTEYPIKKFPVLRHPAYSQVVAENLQNKMLARVLVEGVSPEDAAQEFLDRVKQIFEEWTG